MMLLVFAIFHHLISYFCCATPCRVISQRQAAMAIQAKLKRHFII